MNKGPAILLCSHGKFAKAALESVQLIVGEQKNCSAFAVEVDTNVESFREEIAKGIEVLDTKDGLIIFTDIIGGTPSNTILPYAIKRDKVLAYSGFNLPILIETFLSRSKSLSELQEIIEEAYKHSFINLKEKIKESEEVDNGSSFL